MDHIQFSGEINMWTWNFSAAFTLTGQLNYILSVCSKEFHQFLYHLTNLYSGIGSSSLFCCQFNTSLRPKWSLQRYVFLEILSTGMKRPDNWIHLLHLSIPLQGFTNGTKTRSGFFSGVALHLWKKHVFPIFDHKTDTSCRSFEFWQINFRCDSQSALWVWKRRGNYIQNWFLPNSSFFFVIADLLSFFLRFFF